MRKEQIYKYDYAFSEKDGGFVDVTFYLIKKGKRFQFKVEERGNVIELKEFSKENEACNYFLYRMSTDYPQLKKYIAG